MTIVVKNTNISDLLEVSSGNFGALEKTTEQFRHLVEAPFKRAATASAVQSAVQQAKTAEKP
jgi:hypothetical protein